MKTHLKLNWNLQIKKIGICEYGVLQVLINKNVNNNMNFLLTVVHLKLKISALCD